MRRHGWAYRLINDLEYNHEKQITFHKWMILFWILNIPASLVLVIFFPHLWLSLGVLYVLLLSLYANADTDYDAMSAAEAAAHAKRAKEELLSRGDDD